MPVTLLDWVGDWNPPPFSRWQRLLCRFGRHFGHADYHEYVRQHSPFAMLSDLSPLFTDYPMRKMDAKTYGLTAEKQPPSVSWRQISEPYSEQK